MPSYMKRYTGACGNCVHFRQHYIKIGAGTYHQIKYGHCTFPRNKRRETGDTCPHWKAVCEESLPE